MPIELVTITEYSRRWQIDRHSVYLLIEKGKLETYQTPNEEVLVNLNQRPKVKEWGGIKRLGKPLPKEE